MTAKDSVFIARSLLETGGFRPPNYTLCEEPVCGRQSCLSMITAVPEAITPTKELPNIV
jgi:hypothetical protein